MYNSEDRYRQSLARPGPLGLLIDSTQKNVVSNHFINISKSSDGRRSRSDGSSLVSSSSQNNKNWNESADSKSFVFDEKFQFSVDDTRNQKDQSPDRASKQMHSVLVGKDLLDSELPEGYFIDSMGIARLSSPSTDVEYSNIRRVHNSSGKLSRSNSYRRVESTDTDIGNALSISTPSPAILPPINGKTMRSKTNRFLKSLERSSTINITRIEAPEVRLSSSKSMKVTISSSVDAIDENDESEALNFRAYWNPIDKEDKTDHPGGVQGSSIGNLKRFDFQNGAQHNASNNCSVAVHSMLHGAKLVRNASSNGRISQEIYPRLSTTSGKTQKRPKIYTTTTNNNNSDSNFSYAPTSPLINQSPTKSPSDLTITTTVDRHDDNDIKIGEKAFDHDGTSINSDASAISSSNIISLRMSRSSGGLRVGSTAEESYNSPKSATKSVAVDGNTLNVIEEIPAKTPSWESLSSPKTSNKISFVLTPKIMRVGTNDDSTIGRQTVGSKSISKLSNSTAYVSIPRANPVPPPILSASTADMEEQKMSFLQMQDSYSSSFLVGDKIVSPTEGVNLSTSIVSLSDASSDASDGQLSPLPYQAHKRIMGWKLTSVKRRKELIGLLEKVNTSVMSAAQSQSIFYGSSSDFLVNSILQKKSMTSRGYPLNLPVSSIKRQSSSWQLNVNRLNQARCSFKNPNAIRSMMLEKRKVKLKSLGLENEKKKIKKSHREILDYDDDSGILRRKKRYSYPASSMFSKDRMEIIESAETAQKEKLSSKTPLPPPNSIAGDDSAGNPTFHRRSKSPNVLAPTDDSLANSISATDFLNLMSAFEPDETDEERQYTLEDLFGDNDLEDDGVTDDISSIGEQSSSYINTFFNNLKIAEADQGILALESEKEELSENARDRQNLLDNSPFDNFYDKFATKTAESDA